MNSNLQQFFSETLQAIKDQSLYKVEKEISSKQSVHISVSGASDIINMCANNYLGLSQHPEIQAAAIEGIQKWGYGLSSVRFICGTQSIHTQLESELSSFLNTEDTILYTSCFDANGGLFETILTDEDAVISDELNHASIIDGVRLCKAKRYRYKNNDMQDLEERLREASSARMRLVVTDGVFSMDGYIADIKQISRLCKQYEALLMVDDSHAVGFIGARGRGTHEYHEVMDDVDIITGTLGKALGGASGGYTSGRKEIIELLRQRSRPYLFSNSLPPAIVYASLKALEILKSSTMLRDTLEENTKYFRENISKIGLEVLPGSHPIVPVMLGEAALANSFSKALFEEGVLAVGFYYPVVPKGKARIRTQISAAHTRADLDKALEAFASVKRKLGV